MNLEKSKLQYFIMIVIRQSEALVNNLFCYRNSMHTVFATRSTGIEKKNTGTVMKIVVFLFVFQVILEIRHTIALKTRSFLKMNSNSGNQVQNFAKYHGLGNDFILIDNTESQTPLYTPEQSVKLCNRLFF
jgi:hypothetical protein